MGQAGGFEPSGGGALSGHVEARLDVEIAPFDGGGGQGFEAGRQLANLEGNGQLALGHGGHHRAAEYPDVLGRDETGVEHAAEQGPVIPLDVDLAAFQPDALGIDDRNPLDGEVGQEIASKAFQMQATDRAEPQALEFRGDKRPAHL